MRFTDIQQKLISALSITHVTLAYHPMQPNLHSINRQSHRDDDS